MSAKGRATRLTAVNAAKLAGVDDVSIDRFSFKGANGDTVWGQIVKPKGASAKLPTAFLVHDPWHGRSSWVPVDDVKNGTMDIAGWNQVWLVLDPKTP